ncbi:MAG TPA: hypothetical protein PKE47_03290 [Verrucomicrobiota bacterium]|nr:hypothetical protein [Verrucomicrobiota bacterium]
MTPWATAATWAEYEARIPAIVGRLRPGTDTAPAMGALLRLVRFAPAQRLGRKVSRDPKDDPYLECAVAVRAAAVVTQDRDLLRLEKPFGIPMLTPSEFIHLVRG